MNLNPKSIQRHNGVAFWLNSAGLRAAELFGKQYAFRKTADGWEGHGQTFRTLADAATFILNDY